MMWCKSFFLLWWGIEWMIIRWVTNIFWILPGANAKKKVETTGRQCLFIDWNLDSALLWWLTPATHRYKTEKIFGSKHNSLARYDWWWWFWWSSSSSSIVMVCSGGIKRIFVVVVVYLYMCETPEIYTMFR